MLRPFVRLCVCSFVRSLIHLFVHLFFVDVPVIARSDSGPWWSVDLLVTVDIHLIRIITDAGYDPKDLIHLQVLLGNEKR